MVLSVLDSTGVARNLSTTVDGSGFLVGSTCVTDPSSGNKASVQVFHQADNQQPGATANGLLTGGVAQLINSALNLDRQREVGGDQSPSAGIAAGATVFQQEFQATSTTSVSSGATTATLSIANTNGFKVGGTLNFEPSSTSSPSASYESSTITAVIANTSVTVAFAPGGAAFTHTQPYTVQTFLGNVQRDFAGEGPTVLPIGAEIATEFESNSGGPPLANSLASGWTLDADRNIQGKNNQQMAVTSTTATNKTIVFTGNPWTSGLIVNQALILSTTANGAAVEEVIVSKNNLPVTGAGPITVNLVNPIVNSGSTFATFDAFGLNVPTAGASPLGTEDTLIWLHDPNATDPKRPLFPLGRARGSANAMSTRSGGDTSTLNITADAVVKATPGRAIRIVVNTVTATAAITINDVATTGGTTAGNTILTIPTATAVGTVYNIDWPCLVGIVAKFGTATGALAIAFD